MVRFDAQLGDWREADDGLCSLFDLGGHASGSASSTGSQETSAQFIPSVNISNPPALVSSYPAGQGLATINSAYPGSAAYLPATYAPATASGSSLSLTTLLLLGGAAVGVWFFLRKKR